MPKRGSEAEAGDPPIALVVLDDHPLSRAGVSNVLAAEADINVVAEAATVEQAVRACRRHRPDVVLMDLDLPPAELIESIRRLRRECADGAVVLLSHDDTDAGLYRAAVAGASAHVADAVGPSELASTIRRVATGGDPIGSEIARRPEVGRRVLEAFRELSMQQPAPAAGLPTTRQVQILHLAARGLTNREIGQVVGLSSSSVKAEISTLLRDLGLRHRTHAVVHAIRQGWIKPPETPKLS